MSISPECCWWLQAPQHGSWYHSLYKTLRLLHGRSVSVIIHWYEHPLTPVSCAVIFAESFLRVDTLIPGSTCAYNTGNTPAQTTRSVSILIWCVVKLEDQCLSRPWQRYRVPVGNQSAISKLKHQPMNVMFPCAHIRMHTCTHTSVRPPAPPPPTHTRTHRPLTVVSLPSHPTWSAGSSCPSPSCSSSKHRCLCSSQDDWWTRPIETLTEAE